jgi:hypothetical protein
VHRFSAYAIVYELRHIDACTLLSINHEDSRHTLDRIDKSWAEEKTETDDRAVGRSENLKGVGG